VTVEAGAFRWLVAVVAAVVLGGCGRPGPSNVVLIVVDTLRADYVGCYGGPVGTPSVDALAARGVRFDRAYAHIPITGPSHASMFTSQLPHSHGVRNNAQVLAADRQTLAEALSAAGLKTAGFTSLGTLDAKYGFGQGFDVYPGFPSIDHWREASEVTQEAMQWLETVDDEPWFLWVHYSDPHAPYAPPDLEYPVVRVEVDGRAVGEYPASGRVAAIPLRLGLGTTLVRFSAVEPPPRAGVVFRSWRFRGLAVDIEPLSGFVRVLDSADPSNYRSRLPCTLALTPRGSKGGFGELRVGLVERVGRRELNRRYGLEVSHVDSEIGRLLAAVEELGPAEDTLVVFTSDHGEGLGDHGHGGHIAQLYDTLVRVPLILSCSGRLPSGVVLDGPVRHIDLAPTILDLMGVRRLEEAQGESLVPLIRAGVGGRPVVATTYRPEAPRDLRALVAGGFKYIAAPASGQAELYDLAADPPELDDLHSGQLERGQLMARQLADMLEGDAFEAEEAVLTEEERAALRGLGYLH